MNDGSNSVSTFSVTLGRAGARFRAILKAIPLIGPLAHCSVKHHKEAFKEFALATVFGTATFWLSAALLLALRTNSSSNYFHTLHSTVNSGQLFIFAVGLMGPIILSTAEDPDKSAKFPGRSWHIASLIIAAFVASGFYSFELVARDPKASQFFDRDFLFNASVIIAAFVVMMRYLTIVYRRSTLSPDSPDEIRQRHEDFSDDFARRHQGNYQ
ncbi:MAG: hypothetical protein LBV10_11760 [Stenotrophomonas sp.]|uniref:hypothetical protein n=1 Tax=Stenotrophomonas sp. TaxID=69392 RepID=UPI002850AE49|nr:hypothetical protein [Stenotrophomonas sp.]MDR2960211.1 hypothetical protein [Stenotrophomonas sp.]